MQPNFRSEFLHCWLDPTPSAALNFENREKGNKDGKDQLCKTGKSQVRDNIFENSPERLVSSPLGNTRANDHQIATAAAVYLEAP